MIRSPTASARSCACARARVRRLALTVAGVVLVLSGVGLPAGAAVAHPLESATSSPAGSWVIIPMGHLSDQANTFWQVLHLAAPSSQWSVVTPPGVADNGGLAAGVAGDSVLVGFLPSGRLRFSPLSLSDDAGTTWSPQFLPGGLNPAPDALALEGGSSPRALAIVGGHVLIARDGFSTWSSLASTRTLQRVLPTCVATGPEAASFSASGQPLVATGCGRGGRVGLFSPSSGDWRAVGLRLGGALSQSSTSVLRLETVGTVTAALVEAEQRRRHSLVALWGAGSRWSVSQPFALSSGGAVLATAVGANGSLAVLTHSGNGPALDTIAPGRSWTRLPAPPPHVVAVALVVPQGPSSNPSSADVFAVNGTALRVFALNLSGDGWVRLQSTLVPLAYGSSG